MIIHLEDQDHPELLARCDRLICWQSPQIVHTRYGRRTMRTGTPLPGFWEVWKEHRGWLRERGYSVRRLGTDDYRVVRFSDHSDFGTEELGLSASSHKESTSGEGGDRLWEGLLPYQVAPARALAQAMREHRGTIDASDTGVGKTYIALAAVRAVGRVALVVCKKSGMSAWRRAAKHLGVTLYAVVNWESARTGRCSYLAKTTLGKRVGFSWHVPPHVMVIFDEAHHAKGNGTLNSKLVIGAVDSGVPVHLVSATPAVGVLQMRAMGYVLGLHKDRDFFRWAMQHGAAKNQWGQWSFDREAGREHLRRIANQIWPERGIRVRIRDLGDTFPRNQITTEVIHLDQHEELATLYLQLEEYLEKLRERTEQYRDTYVTRVLELRQKIELLKVPTVCDMAQEALEAGLSVVVFANFLGTIEALMDGLKTDCVVCGLGSLGLDEHKRRGNVDRFQANQSPVIICQSQSGGESIDLHDVHGQRQRMSLIMPVYSAVTFRQIVGRIHRSGSKSAALQRLILVGGTVEEKVADRLQAALGDLENLTDADLMIEGRGLGVRSSGLPRGVWVG